eukprot:2522292-Alexandrium_andersonii.AAC.2
MFFSFGVRRGHALGSSAPSSRFQERPAVVVVVVVVVDDVHKVFKGHTTTGFWAIRRKVCAVDEDYNERWCEAPCMPHDFEPSAKRLEAANLVRKAGRRLAQRKSTRDAVLHFHC